MAGVIEGVIGVIGGVIGVIEGGRISHCFRAIHSCYKLYHHRQRHFGPAVHTCRIKTARGSVYFVHCPFIPSSFLLAALALPIAAYNLPCS